MAAIRGPKPGLPGAPLPPVVAMSALPRPPVEYPTPWQRRMLWTSLTAFAFTGLLAIIVGALWTFSAVIGFLQPLLIPFAVAGVLAFLLEPVVEFLVRRGLSRSKAVTALFAVITLLIALFFSLVLPGLYRQTAEVAGKMPAYARKLQEKLPQWAEAWQARVDRLKGMLPSPKPEPTPAPAAEPGASAPAPTPAPAPPLALKKTIFDPEYLLQWVEEKGPAIAQNALSLLGRSLGGFLGVIGFVFSAVIVPFCLWYFLKEGDQIKAHWGEYLPLRQSRFKDELVSVLGEINGYIIAFFRGQLIVSLIDGTLLGIALLVMGLDFALLIGLLAIFLTLIPYLGVILCWIPAVLIAALQFGDWQHPLAVTLIFAGVQQFEGFVIAPRVVGETVGLHPLTVILSAVGWSLLLGGLLGALLAVPLSAACKVLLRRYVWSRRERTWRSVPAPH